MPDPRVNTFTIDQIGTGIGVWNEVPQPFNFGIGVAGIRVQIHTDFEPSRNIARNPRFPTSMTLNLPHDQGAGESGLIALVFDSTTAAPEVWSGSNLASDIVAVLGTPESPGNTLINGASWSGDPLSIAVPDTSDPQLVRNWEHYLSLIRSSQWNGYVAFSLLVTSVTNGFTFNDETDTPAPTLDVTSVPFHTGHGSEKGSGRAVHCPKLGTPVMTTEMVRDGFFENMLVCQDGFDPRDPEPRYVPNPKEGVVDDDAQSDT